MILSFEGVMSAVVFAEGYDEETEVVVEEAVEKTLVVVDIVAVDIAVEGVGSKVMSDGWVVVVEATFVNLVEEVFGIVLVIFVEGAAEGKEPVEVGVKGVLVGCVSDMQKDSKPPASKQKLVSGNLSGLT